MIQTRLVTVFFDPDGGTQAGAISPHMLKHATLVDLSIPVKVDLFLTGGGSEDNIPTLRVRVADNAELGGRDRGAGRSWAYGTSEGGLTPGYFRLPGACAGYLLHLCARNPQSCVLGWPVAG